MALPSRTPPGSLTTTVLLALLFWGPASTSSTATSYRVQMNLWSLPHDVHDLVTWPATIWLEEATRSSKPTSLMIVPVQRPAKHASATRLRYRTQISYDEKRSSDMGNSAYLPGAGTVF